MITEEAMMRYWKEKVRKRKVALLLKYGPIPKDKK
ncbi:hypothetical protein PS2_113 [Serratia phage PS2]|uniref:Uncharacterized protein n=1 Tax=Serratia phage PS2 TaxID=1481112 RepID=A0A023W4V0_9CAUD|nr:hypothetical protein FF83_gp113 [Serratia phage PS2]AHY25359.1 hypothetical protein PS2_113 [Serratia phage PS2]